MLVLLVTSIALPASESEVVNLYTGSSATFGSFPSLKLASLSSSRLRSVVIVLLMLITVPEPGVDVDPDDCTNQKPSLVVGSNHAYHDNVKGGHTCEGVEAHAILWLVPLLFCPESWGSSVVSKSSASTMWFLLSAFLELSLYRVYF